MDRRIIRAPGLHLVSDDARHRGSALPAILTAPAAKPLQGRNMANLTHDKKPATDDPCGLRTEFFSFCFVSYHGP